MKVCVLDDVQSRAVEIAERLRNDNHEVTDCVLSNDFMNALRDRSPEALLIDFGAWVKGKAMYTYFDVASKFAKIPVVLYNTPENFSELPNRPKHEKDIILPKPSSVDTIVGSLDGIG